MASGYPSSTPRKKLARDGVSTVARGVQHLQNFRTLPYYMWILRFYILVAPAELSSLEQMAPVISKYQHKPGLHIMPQLPDESLAPVQCTNGMKPAHLDV